MRKALVDRFLNLVISKKLTVFLIGTFFAYNSTLDGEQWLNLSYAYITGQSIIDVIKEFKNK